MPTDDECALQRNWIGLSQDQFQTKIEECKGRHGLYGSCANCRRYPFTLKNAVQGARP